ncbi:MAG: hypothetical protein ABR964_15415 [Tepidisphaeraceae bacterium]|jgi:hypothetical protein
MVDKAGQIREWQNRIDQMKRCRDASELVEKFGSPPHKDQNSSMEIWHYPLGTVDGRLYSIHAAIIDDQPQQVYMFMEPTADVGASAQPPGPPRKRPWWRLFR